MHASVTQRFLFGRRAFSRRFLGRIEKKLPHRHEETR
jgi:hypothetical protein